MITLMSVLGMFLLIYSLHKGPQWVLDDDAIQRTNNKVADLPESIDIPGYPDQIVVSEGSNVLDLNLYNPETNLEAVHFKYTIGLHRDDTDITLYTSDLIAPGYTVDQQPLLEPLEEGIHDAYISVRTFLYEGDVDDVYELNGATLQTRIIVK